MIIDFFLTLNMYLELFEGVEEEKGLFFEKKNGKSWKSLCLPSSNLSSTRCSKIPFIEKYNFMKLQSQKSTFFSNFQNTILGLKDGKFITCICICTIFPILRHCMLSSLPFSPLDTFFTVEIPWEVAKEAWKEDMGKLSNTLYGYILWYIQ